VRRPHGLVRFCLVATAILMQAVSGCRAPSAESEDRRFDASAEDPQEDLQHPAFPQKLGDDLPGLHNVIWVGDGLLSGGEPQGEEGFASLARLGIKTVVSVDGARPNIESARESGIRYVHIPIGYDSVPNRAGLALARVAREADGPVYIHCHLGRHRGPAAAAIACIASGKTKPKEALQILETAGTGKEYAGLWRDVEAYIPPSADAELPELFEAAPVESLAAAMSSIDRHWDNLKLCRDSGWQTPSDHPDLAAAQEALVLREAFHEASRAGQSGRFDERFQEWLAEAESVAAALEAGLRQPEHEDADERLQHLERSCKRCHEAYRN